MCGIAGVYRYKTSRAVEAAEVDAMCAQVVHRGPDGGGRHTSRDFGVGHRRLSIIDVSDRAGQPMHSADGHWILSYNGEIYNYLELREELIAEGCRFTTTSDTEVLLAAFRQWGLESLSRFNGMYAFAIWHEPTRTLTLVRDRVGIKPLYYCETSQGLAFASEIKSLLTLPEVSVRTNHRLLDGYLGVGYCPGEETLFHGIHRLLPGHYLQVRDGVIDERTYWDLTFDRAHDQGESVYIEGTRQLLDDAVRMQLRSDVPLGVFLSGGVDSSAVVATMHRLGVSNIKTFSVLWDYGPGFDEGQYARQVARQFNTEHHEWRMTPRDFLASLPHYVWHMDEPVQEPAAISLYHIARKAREHATVVLSGEGADEVFGGYPVYRYMQWLERYRALPSALRRTLNPMLSRWGTKWQKHLALARLPLSERYFGVPFHEMSGIRHLYSPRLQQETRDHAIEQLVAEYYQCTNGHDAQTRMQYLDVKSWLVDDLLIKADRMSMATSLELRVPLLDHRFLEFAARMPSKYQLRRGHGKYILKKAVEPLLPRNIVYRKKLGFPTPLKQLFQGPLQGYVQETLLSEQFLDRGLFRADAVQGLVNEHRAGAADHHKILWRLLVLELWHRIFVDRESWQEMATAESMVAA